MSEPQEAPESAPEAAQDPTQGMSDDQLIDGNELIEAASNGFMSSTFNIPADGGAPKAQEKKPTEDAFSPSSEANEETVQLSLETVELERREAEVRRQQRELDDHYSRLDAQRDPAPEFGEKPWETFKYIMKERGLDPGDAFERLTADLLEEDTEAQQQHRLNSRHDEMTQRVAQLESRLQEQAYVEEEQQLWTGLEGRLQEMAVKWPIASARGNTSVGEVFTHIIRHQEETGEVLDANAVFQQYEDGLRQQIQELTEHDAVRQLIGLAAKQQNQPQSVSAHEVVQGTPTLTNQSAGERSVLSSQDEMLDDDDIIRLASEAFLGG